MSPLPPPASSSDPSAEGARAARAPTDLGRFWTVPNAITLARVTLVPPLAWLAWHGGPLGWILVLALVAVATDVLDGAIARRTGAVSEWGKLLDPVADKLAAAAVTLALVLRPEAHGPTLPVWFVVLVVGRDALLAAGGVVQTRRMGFVLMSLPSGKAAVALLAATVLATLVAAPEPVRLGLLWATTALLGLSFLQYARRFAAAMRWGEALPLDRRHRVDWARLRAR